MSLRRGPIDRKKHQQNAAKSINCYEKLFVIQDVEAWNPSMRSSTSIRSSSKRNLIDPSSSLSYYHDRFVPKKELQKSIYALVVKGELANKGSKTYRQYSLAEKKRNEKETYLQNTVSYCIF
jgi:hypothetical protein